MGSDRQVAGASEIERYFEAVASTSDRVRVIDIGKTTDGHRTIAALVSAPENIGRLAEIRAANQRLSDPRTLTPEDAKRLAATHPAIVAIGCSMHAWEIGASQAASELLHTLATSTDPETLDVLQHVVVILIPLLNPDGHRSVVDWYERTKNTPFEGGPLPWLYQKYASHDVNRDAFMMNLAESRNLARFFYTEWHPQVFLTLHQMTTTAGGVRMVVPPVADPIDLNYDALIWRESALLGGAMALELQRDGRKGVISNALYDYYWPGYEDSAPLGHNVVCLLAEVAGVKIATPQTVAADDLAGPRGTALVPQVLFPDPWPGGRWTLRDIVDYDLSAARGLLHAASAYRERLVSGFYEMGARAIENGRRGGPFAFAIPPDQFDTHATAALENLLIAGGIEVHRTLEPFVGDDRSYPAGTDVILLAQPYRAYVKTLLERQNYPARRSAANNAVERPYDVAGWTLPAQMGVEVRAIERAFEAPVMSRLTRASIAPARVWGEKKPSHYLVDGHGNGGAVAINRLLAANAATAWISDDLDVDGYRFPAGSLLVTQSKTSQPVVERLATELGLRATALKRKPQAAAMALMPPRVGVYKPWTENADEGWTRWLLERYEFNYRSLSDADIKAGDLRRQFDAIVLPSAPPDQLRSGNAADLMPAEYVGGLSEAGVAALRTFVDAGGTLVCLDQACGLVSSEFKIGLRDVAREASVNEFFCPGSILNLDLDPRQPLAYGMPARTAGFFGFSSAYDLTSAANVTAVAARYAPKNLLVSGWLEGEAIIAARAAVVEVKAGAGRLVLLGFPVQHRAQSHATFRLLFNALFMAAQAPEGSGDAGRPAAAGRARQSGQAGRAGQAGTKR